MTKYEEYEGMPEVVPGVFISPGDAVYIVDDEGEIATWNYDEICQTDGDAFTAALFAVALAASWGPKAVRDNIVRQGEVLDDLHRATATKIRR